MLVLQRPPMKTKSMSHQKRNLWPDRFVGCHLRRLRTGTGLPGGA
jgi:hypothetical protein